jgi:hypothetical protein
MALFDVISLPWSYGVVATVVVLLLYGLVGSFVCEFSDVAPHSRSSSSMRLTALTSSSHRPRTSESCCRGCIQEIWKYY